MNRFTTALTAITFLFPAATALADSPSPSKEASQPAEIATPSGADQRLDPTAFCYVGDKAYSEGWRLDGLICAKGPIANVFKAEEQPLAWRRITATD